ncbi:MAG: hypothetical protein ACO31Y_09195 [Vulcanococcus sp.]
MHAAPLRAAARAAMAMVLAALILISGGCSKSPAKSTARSAQSVAASSKPSGQLQEVAAPGGVQQLSERLNERAPQIAVLSPADDSTLPAGPWSLRLKVEDWPISSSQATGIGPHVVVQVDDQEPLRVSDPGALAEISMPELLPGSHRLTVYAARPWGEAVKAPGASTQLKLHRVARNASQLPIGGSAQLIATSPNELQHSEPVLIDWLLIDAPLQHLRDDDARWRLRVSINGDSFLVDRQTPLWLKGFKRGSNAVQLELLDGRGDPLNPPFNSLVREVVIDGSAKPAWQAATLSGSALAELSGEPLPAPAPEPEPTPEPIPQPTPQPTSEPSPEPSPEPAAMAETERLVVPPAREVAEEPETEATTEDENAPEPAPKAESEPKPEPAPAPKAAPAPEPKPEPKPEPASPGLPRESTTLAPSSKLSGSARDLVNANGSLIEAQPRGPLAGLKAKLGG